MSFLAARQPVDFGDVLVTNVSRREASCVLPFAGMGAVNVFDSSVPSSMAALLLLDAPRDAIRDFSGRNGDARDESSECCRSGRFRLLLAGGIAGTRSQRELNREEVDVRWNDCQHKGI